MLTEKTFFKAAKQLQSFGELPPGFVDSQASNLTGPIVSQDGNRSAKGELDAEIEISMSVSRDSSGELRIIIA